MPLSPEQCHEHEHKHNRHNPMHNFDRGPNTATDHHNPFDSGWSSRKNFTHDHEHCHIGDRIGHDPEVPDSFKDTPMKKYYHVPNEPWTPFYGFNEDTRVNDDGLRIAEDGVDFAWA